VKAGSLRDGQKLYLHDYHGARVNAVVAVVRGNKLEMNGELRSMSNLAREHLNAQGYRGDSFRGPSFWRTGTGQSVTDLWEEYLAEEMVAETSD